MELHNVDITESMVKEFCSWKYEESYVPILTYEDIKIFMPEMLDIHRKNIEFIAFIDEENNFVSWCRGRLLNIRNQRVIYLGFAVKPNCQGKGVGKKILSMSKDIFLNRYGNYPFIADIEAENLRSIRLVQALNFEYLYNVEVEDCGVIKITRRYKNDS